MNKSELRRLALTVREEVNLGPHDVFDPFHLAKAYGIDVVKLSDIDCSPAAREHFQVSRPEVFSGALVPMSDGSTVIIENDVHPRERRVSTGSHEMSHVVLEHPFRASLTDGKGCRIADQELEAEATELGGELLIPFEAAKKMAYYKVSDEDAARRFKVSVDLARWRMNVSGARKIASRAHAKRR